jgi:hypothetical protein
MPTVIFRPSKQIVTHLWKTGIQKGIKGNEKRSALYTFPRLKIDTTYSFVDTSVSNWFERSYMFNLDELWGIPIWSDETYLTSQATAGTKILNVQEVDYRHFYDGRGCIITDGTDYEICTISGTVASGTLPLESNLENTWSINDSVLPYYQARIDQEQIITKHTRDYDELSIMTVESYEASRSFTYSTPDSGATTFSGIDILSNIPVGTISRIYERPYELLQFLGIGQKYSNYVESCFPLEASLLETDRSTIWDIFKFFDNKMGRLYPFWVPTWNKDIIVTSAISDTDTLLTIQDIDYNITWLTNDVQGRFIRIRFPDKSIIYRKIVEAGPTTITLESAVGKNVSADNLNELLISYLYYVRFEADEISMEYNPANTSAKTYMRTTLYLYGLSGENIV